MDKNMFLNTIQEYKELGMSNNSIDYDKFYLYSIVTRSTAIEKGLTMTEVENQVLFEEGLGRPGERAWKNLI